MQRIRFVDDQADESMSHKHKMNNGNRLKLIYRVLIGVSNMAKSIKNKF